MAEVEVNGCCNQLSEAEIKELEERTQLRLNCLTTGSPIKLKQALENPKSPIILRQFIGHSGIKLVTKKSPTTVKPFSFELRENNKKENRVPAHVASNNTSKGSNAMKSLNFNKNLEATAGKEVPALVTHKNPSIVITAVESLNLSKHLETSSEKVILKPLLGNSRIQFVTKKSAATVKPFTLELRAKNKKENEQPDKEPCSKSNSIRKTVSDLNEKSIKKHKINNLKPSVGHSGIQFVSKKMPTTVKPFTFELRAKNKKENVVPDPVAPQNSSKVTTSMKSLNFNETLGAISTKQQPDKESCSKSTKLKTAVSDLHGKSIGQKEQELPVSSQNPSKIPTTLATLYLNKTSEASSGKVCFKGSAAHSGMKFLPKIKNTVAKPFSFDRKSKDLNKKP